jgi:uncharacterized protein (TIGR01777 family)
VNVVLAGGSGALGRRLCGALTAQGHDPVVLTRAPKPDSPYRQVTWNGRDIGEWARELDGAAVINLAGELVDRRPTAAGIELLTQSRVQPTLALAAAAAANPTAPPVWLQMSTLAIYGDGGDAVLDETALAADGPPQMTDVAQAWEAAAAGVPAERQVILRTAVVLDRGTPAMDRLAGLVRWGLGGQIGDGRPWVSWLHVDDFVAIVLRVLDDSSMQGVVHATSPNPVRNSDLMAELRRVLHRPRTPPTPKVAVRLGAVLLRTDPALALTGRRCVPGRLIEAGFTFDYPCLGPALENLLGET